MTRREVFALAAAPVLAQTPGRGSLLVCMHQASSAKFDFRTAMEGYARAGVRAVEVALLTVRDFENRESPGAARRLLGDLGLRAVSSSNQGGLAEPGVARAKSLEDLKWKCELAEALGCDRMVAPSSGRERYTADDFKIGAENLRQAGEIARPHRITLMVEFVRTSTFIGTLRTALKVVREAAHPNVRVMLDTFHFWNSSSKFEDLELLGDGELHHLHFEDTPAQPPSELLEQRHRVYPGEGIAPLRRIVEVLKKKGYSGPASLELFDPVVQATDPFEVARKARATIEPLIA
jgi:2-keto-myo-inositol isomerase